MSSPPPPSKKRLFSDSKAKTKSSDNGIQANQQQETEGTFVKINSDFSDSQWSEREEFPPGYRFCPLDGELIVYYLQKKVNNKSMPYNRIQDVNLYMHNPDYLAVDIRCGSTQRFEYTRFTDQYQVLGDDAWYFYTPRDRKYRKGKRPKRAAGDGYWKATGADKPVEHQGIIVGKKKSLVFYLGKPPSGDKTNWIMQEYTVNAPPRIKKHENDMRLDDWVLCKIYKKKATDKSKRGEEQDQHEPIESSVTSPEEVAHRDNYDNHFVDMNYNYNICNGYIQPTRVLPPVLPPFSDSCFPNYSNFATYHPQQQVVRVQSVGIIPPLVHSTQGFIMPKYNIQENFGSISTLDNLLGSQHESLDTLPFYHGLLPHNP